MSASTCRLFTSLAVLLAASTVAACTSFGTEDAPASAGAGADDPAAEGPKATPVPGSPETSDITEELGIFVSAAGRASGDGSRLSPLATIQAGIQRGKALGKRVYVCSGTYRETLTLSDSISIIGGLECKGITWKLGGAPSRIEAVSSPAVRAKDITSPTRLEGLAIVAPNAAEAGASSIGLLAERSAGITIAGSTITAGNAADGANGTDGTKLVLDAVAAEGQATVSNAPCVYGSTCSGLAVGGGPITWSQPRGGGGGTSLCAGAPDHNGQPGGAGGSGGLSEWRGGWAYYMGSAAAYAPAAGETRAAVPAAAGIDGTTGATIGTFSAEGYVGVSGGAGTDGAPGNGGSGGRGAPPTGTTNVIGEVWRGNGGPGGGAGGCPGLAGTPGTGGGASIALALVDSPIVLDATMLVAGKGGTGGRGSFGSDPSPGGRAGRNLLGTATFAATDGQHGGAPGISTNGSSGPSIGILHSGAPATLQNGAKAIRGAGGDAIAAASHTVFGATRTIPATPAGLALEVLSR